LLRLVDLLLPQCPRQSVLLKLRLELLRLQRVKQRLPLKLLPLLLTRNPPLQEARCAGQSCT